MKRLLQKPNSMKGLSTLETVIAIGILGVTIFAGVTFVAQHVQSLAEARRIGEDEDIRRYIDSYTDCATILSDHVKACEENKTLKLPIKESQGAKYDGESIRFANAKVDVKCKVQDGLAVLHGTVEDTSSNSVRPLYNVPKVCALNTSAYCGFGARKITSTLTFPRTTNECPWGVNGNMGKDQGYLGARREQVVTISLPSDVREICNFRLNLRQREIEYDDTIVFTINDMVIATNGFANTTLNSWLTKNPQGLYIYNWFRMRNRSYNRDIMFCAEGVDCRIPPSERRGQIFLDIHPDFWQKSEIFLPPIPTSINMRVIVMGNKQGSDCQHSGMTFDYELEYYTN